MTIKNIAGVEMIERRHFDKACDVAAKAIEYAKHLEDTLKSVQADLITIRAALEKL